MVFSVTILPVTDQLYKGIIKKRLYLQIKIPSRLKNLVKLVITVQKPLVVKMKHIPEQTVDVALPKYLYD